MATYVYSREVPPDPRIDLVTGIGATYVSTHFATFADLAEQVGNIDLVCEVPLEQAAELILGRDDRHQNRDRLGIAGGLLGRRKSLVRDGSLPFGFQNQT